MRVHEILEDAGTYYATNDVVAWSKLNQQQQAQWQQRQQQLNSRVQQIYARLQSVMSQQDRSRLTAISVSVPLHGDSKYARADWKGSAITIDVGAFWDLSDDCLAYTLGHEIGHMVYYSKNDRRPGFWTDKVTNQQSRKEELDADTYGAVLAYRLGYNAQRAFDFFSREIQQARAQPNDSYPSVQQRQAAQAQAIKRAGPQPKENIEEPVTQPAGVPDLPTSAGAVEDMQHAMAGIENLGRVLQQDPQIALHLFPAAAADTRLA